MRALRLGALVLLAAAAGCVSGSDACQSDSDCTQQDKTGAEFLVCEGGFCVRGCDEHEDCDRGCFCEDGHCRQRPPQEQGE